MLKALRERFSQQTGKHITSGQLTNSFDRRAMLIGAAQGGLGLILAGRMTWIAVYENSKYAMLSESNRVNLSLIPPRRGWILDRHNQPLASNRTDFRIDLIPDRLVDPDKTVKLLGQIMAMNSYRPCRLFRSSSFAMC